MKNIKKDIIIFRLWTLVVLLGMTVYFILAEVIRIKKTEGEFALTLPNIIEIIFSPALLPIAFMIYCIYREFLSGRESIFAASNLSFEVKDWLRGLIIWVPAVILLFLSPFLAQKGMYMAARLCEFAGITLVVIILIKHMYFR